MVMRVGGIVSGMDIEAMVNKLMEAERMPLDRLKQQQTQLEWKRDAFRDINSKLLDLDNMMLDMKMTTTYNPKTATSSQSSASTATYVTSVSNGSYGIEVKELATRAMNVGRSLEGVGIKTKMKEGPAEGFSFTTYDKSGQAQE